MHCGPLPSLLEVLRGANLPKAEAVRMVADRLMGDTEQEQGEIRSAPASLDEQSDQTSSSSPAFTSLSAW